MTSTMDRHTFLAALHHLLEPRGYVEVGVQTGASLRLADCPALGIDPAPVLRYALPSTTRLAMKTSDDFFALPGSTQRGMGLPEFVDLAFIDGMHLHEFALRDFANVERYSNDRTVVVFDDVLPRNQVEGSRTPNPNDWAGDVWKVAYILETVRPDLSLTLVDSEPTGLLIVTDLNPSWSGQWPEWGDGDVVPDEVLKRTLAVTPEAALEQFAGEVTS